MNLSKAQNIISKLLESTNIKHIFYIDDTIDISESVANLCARFALFDEEQWEINEIPTRVRECYDLGGDYQAAVKEWLLELDDNKTQRIFDKLGIENKFINSTIASLLGNSCKVFTHISWESTGKYEYEQCLLNKEKVLLLFDKNLDNSKDGTEIAKIALSMTNADSFSYCGIISQSFSIDKEFDERVKYEHLFYPISKYRINAINEDYELFVEGIKNTLWLKHIERVKAITCDIAEESVKSCTEFIKTIQPPTFDKIVIGSSQKEGARELDTMVRLMSIIIEDTIRTELLKNIKNGNSSDIYEHFNAIEKINETKIKSATPNTQQIIDIQQRESINSINTVNGLYNPLQNGDIFTINDKYYILLCQPCNISLRSKGKRSGKNGFLVPLTTELEENNHEISEIFKELKKQFTHNNIQLNIDGYKKQINELTNSAKLHHAKLPFLLDNQQYYALLNKYVTIDLDIFDYATFSDDGIVRIGVETRNELHSNQKHRKKILDDIYSDWKIVEHYLSTLKLEEEIYTLFRKKMQPNCLHKLGINYTTKDNQVYTLPIQRIGNLKDPFSSTLLRQLSQYISRTGLPNSFI